MSYKRWLLVAIFLFVVGFGGGLTSGLANPEGIVGPFSEDIAGLEELAGFLASLPQSSVFLLILVKNTSAVLISFALSPIFCLAPVAALIFNGGLLGFVSAMVIEEKSLGYLLAGLLPHGIFELPALIIGEAVALSFGTAVLLALFKKERRSQLRPHLRHNLRYLLVALGLFLPAAIIETYITPLLLR
ncbi:MAG: stage II sporulation protein M [Chloroflexi bacterium]|nr:stage II sporulation protein M [Chloroflexota bacterium]